MPETGDSSSTPATTTRTSTSSNAHSSSCPPPPPLIKPAQLLPESKKKGTSSSKALLPRLSSPSVSTTSKSLFTEHDNDWPTVDLGNLITDLDADINQSTDIKGAMSTAAPPPNSSSSSASKGSSPSVSASASKIIPIVERGSSCSNKDSRSSIVDPGEKGLKMKIKRNKSTCMTTTTTSSTICSSSSSLSHHSNNATSSNSSSNISIPAKSSSSSSPTNSSNILGSPLKSMEGGGGGSPPAKHEGTNDENSTNNTGAASGKVTNHISNSSNSGNNSGETSLSHHHLSSHHLTPKPGVHSHHTPLSPVSSAKQNGGGDTSPTDGGMHLPSGGAPAALSQATNNCSSQKSNSGTSSNSFLKIDASVGTEIGTMTEPDCLGPLDPGTSVTLGGIVWHETEGGVLVINVTWRGKTYVGTLLDSTQHVNQYSESPTAEIDNKKGRGNKRAGRPGSEPELTRKNLRSSKGKPLKNAASSPSKRKKGFNKDEDNSNDSTSSHLKRQRTSSKNNSADENEDGVDSEKESSKDPPELSSSSSSLSSTGKEGSSGNSKEAGPSTPGPVASSNNASSSGPPPGSAPAVPPLEGEMTPKDPKEVKYIPPPPLPYALTCPSPGCKKRYRQHNGLRFHISHSHKELLDSKGDIRDTSDIDRCEKEAKERLRKRGILLEEEQQQRDAAQKASKAVECAPKASEAVSGQSSKVEGEEDKVDEAGGGEELMETEPASPPSSSESSLLHHSKQGDAKESQNGEVKEEIATTVVQQSSPEEEPSSKMVHDNAESNNNANANSSSLVAKSPAYSDISDDGGEDESKSKSSTSGDLKVKKPTGIAAAPGIITSTSSSNISTSSGSSLAPAPPVSMDSSPSSVLLPSPSSLQSSSLPPMPPSAAPTSNHFPFAPYIPSTTSSGPITTTSSSSFKPEVSPGSKPPPSAGDYQKMLQAYGFPPSFPPFPGPMDKEKDIRRRSSLSGKTPEDLRKRSVISVKPEFNVPKSEPGRKTPQTNKEEGAKPTMETRGPPPASINPYGSGGGGYLHPSLMRPPMGLSYEALAAAAGSINPLLLSPNPYMPNPYLPPHLRPPYGASPDILRGAYPPPNGPEDLSRSVSVGPPSGGSNSSSGNPPPKALDLLQQHASQYYSSNASSHKIHELGDRSRKSPSTEKGGKDTQQQQHSVPTSSQQLLSGAPGSAGRKRTPSPAGQLSGLNRSRSPPPLRHVHTHTHTHFGLGYPLLHPPGSVPPPAAHTPFNPGSYPSHLLPPSGAKGSLPSGSLGQGFPPPPK